MSNQDTHLLRIDPTWLMNDKSGEFLAVRSDRWNYPGALERISFDSSLGMALPKGFNANRGQMTPSSW